MGISLPLSPYQIDQAKSNNLPANSADVTSRPAPSMTGHLACGWGTVANLIRLRVNS